MKKKVGILTFHLSNNYGALLQCHALLAVLKNMGHEPFVINKTKTSQNQSESNWTNSVPKFLKKQIDSLLFFKGFISFRKKHIRPLTTPASSTDDLTHLCANLDAVIVGSDQVWRLQYTESSLSHYFLDFVPDNIKKIAYAASFGKDQFEGNEELRGKIEKLLKRFNAISVREDSGVDICKETFHVDASHVLDPTLLLNASDYDHLIKKNESTKNESIVYYFLDPNNYKLQYVNFLKKEQNINHSYNNFVSNTFSWKQKRIPSREDVFYPSFSAWLNGIKTAKIVVTDSFHGVAFCIIFKKQFICILNQDRGSSRILSMTKTLGLTDRILTEEQAVAREVPSGNIDYENIEKILSDKRNESLAFLRNAIENDNFSYLCTE